MIHKNEQSYWETHYSPVCENRFNGKVIEAYLDVATHYKKGMLAEIPSAEISPFAYFMGNSIYDIPKDRILVTEEFCKEYEILDKAILIDSRKKIYSIEWDVFVNQIRPTRNELLRLFHIDEYTKSFDNSNMQIRRALERKIKNYKPKELNPNLEESEVPTPVWIRHQKEVQEKRLKEKNSAIYLLYQNVGFIERVLKEMDLISTQLDINGTLNTHVVKEHFIYLTNLCIEWIPRKKERLKEIARKFTSVNRFDYSRFSDFLLTLTRVFQLLLEIVDVMTLVEFRDKNLDLIKRYEELEF